MGQVKSLFESHLLFSEVKNGMKEFAIEKKGSTKLERRCKLLGKVGIPLCHGLKGVRLRDRAFFKT